jgi:hypothetical protein
MKQTTNWFEEAKRVAHAARQRRLLASIPKRMKLDKPVPTFKPNPHLYDAVGVNGYVSRGCVTRILSGRAR